MASPLADLDELILKCRDDKAKQYIQESVLCYKAGAFRSAIISTWIAVAFDIIDKIRELALAGDQEAEKHIKDFDKITESGDIIRALAFEKGLLDLARDKLELISHVEYIDLQRIQHDRNRCAHPSLTSEGQVFSPSAELARVHISSAVNHLLQYPPAQGKYALVKLINEVDSEYFPQDEKGALLAFKSGPLKKPRESLVRNFIVVLLKRLLKEDLDYKVQGRTTAALKAVQSMHSILYATTNSEKLSDIARSIADSNLSKLLVLIRTCPDLWNYLESDVQQRLEIFVKTLPRDEFECIEYALELEPLADAAQLRLNSSTRAELGKAGFFALPIKVADRIIDGYLASRSYDEANEWAKLIVRNAIDFTPSQVKKIISNVSENRQVIDSFEFGSVIHALRSIKKIDNREFETILEETGLQKYSIKKAEDEV